MTANRSSGARRWSVARRRIRWHAERFGMQSVLACGAFWHAERSGGRVHLGALSDELPIDRQKRRSDPCGEERTWSGIRLVSDKRFLGGEYVSRRHGPSAVTPSQPAVVSSTFTERPPERLVKED